MAAVSTPLVAPVGVPQACVLGAPMAVTKVQLNASSWCHAVGTATWYDSPLVDEDEDAYTGMILCGRGVRKSRKSCAFCANRAIVQCDGDRCIRQLCADHRWSANENLDFCPPCENKFHHAAATPKQIELFRASDVGLTSR